MISVRLYFKVSFIVSMFAWFCCTYSCMIVVLPNPHKLSVIKFTGLKMPSETPTSHYPESLSCRDRHWMWSSALTHASLHHCTELTQFTSLHLLHQSVRVYKSCFQQRLCFLKAIFHPEIINLSFTCPHAVPNLYEFVSSVKTQKKFCVCFCFLCIQWKSMLFGSQNMCSGELSMFIRQVT